MSPRPRWSRRRWIAEQLGCDLAEVEPYQDTRTPRGGVPRFQYEGRIVVVALDASERAKAAISVEDITGYTTRQHWRDAAVTIYVQKETA